MLGVAAGQVFYGVHDGQWIEKGLPGGDNITAFNNGPDRPGTKYSSVEEFTPRINADGSYPSPLGQPYEPSTSNWRYTASPPTDLFANHLSSAQRLPNGNTLICDGTHGTFIEVTPQMETVWKYLSPVAFDRIYMQGETIPVGPAGSANIVFKVRKYPADYPGFAGKDLTPGSFIEKYPTNAVSAPARLPVQVELTQSHPNPCGSTADFEFVLPDAQRVDIALYDARGTRLQTLRQGELGTGRHRCAIDASHLSNGIYFYRAQAGTAVKTKAMTVLH